MSQLARLSDYEERAEQAVRDVNLGIERFASVLKEIKDLGLYKGEHETFEDYCRARWGRSLRTVQRALKAHDTRQKLLAAAPGPEKEAIQKASTTAILDKSKEMDHLLIGRKQPTATKLSDFYSSNEPVDNRPLEIHADINPGEVFSSYEDIAERIKFGLPKETDGQIAQRVLLAFMETQGPEYHDYLRWVAQEIAK